MIDALHKVIKRLHYPLEVMLTCVRWYAAYPLSLRHVEEMMAERGVFRRGKQFWVFRTFCDGARRRSIIADLFVAQAG